jgi:hypothetical protein
MHQVRQMKPCDDEASLVACDVYCLISIPGDALEHLVGDSYRPDSLVAMRERSKP